VSREIIVWVLSALAVVVVALTRVRLGSSTSGGGKKVSRLALNVHTTAGVLAVLVWTAFLVTTRDLLGMVGLLLWWVTVFAGLALLMRWLPSHGRHASHDDEDDWAEGPGLSMLAHLGLLLGVGVFTWAYAVGVV